MRRYSLQAVNYRAIGKNTLTGSVDLVTPGAMRIKGVLWHQSHGKEWVSMPAIPWVDDRGDKKWRNIIEFETPEAGELWQLAALDAIHLLLGTMAERDGAGAHGTGIL